MKRVELGSVSVPAIFHYYSSGFFISHRLLSLSLASKTMKYIRLAVHGWLTHTCKCVVYSVLYLILAGAQNYDYGENI